MYKQHTKSTIISSLFWKLLERGGTHGIQFVIQIVLARLLLPEEYGIIAIVNVFILFGNVFVQSGLNTALIQKKDTDEIDFSSVFFLSLFIAALLYILLFIMAPFIAEFYQNSQLVMILRTLSFILFFGAFNSIQNAYIAKNMMFKKLFYSSLGAILVSGFIGIVAAYIGLGVWALVIQQVTNQLFITVIMWFTVKWRPILSFSFKRVKNLFPLDGSF
jgi:teichuronic acid exporter